MENKTDCTICKFYKLISVKKKFNKKRKRRKTHVLLENNQAAHMSSHRKKTLTELPKLKYNKMLNKWDRANIRKIILDIVNCVWRKN